MRKNTLSLLTLLLFLPHPSRASDTRVAATGGLLLLITDEAVAPQPFVLGNPAGLALLPHQNRFELSASVFDQQVPISSRDSQFYGTYELGVDLIKYRGLLLFPFDHFALQLDGDIRHLDDRIPMVLLADGIDRTQELLRLAYDFGPFVLGVEAKSSQTPVTFGFQSSSYSSLGAYGNGNVTQWDVTGGLLARFPSDPGIKEPRVTVGGVYGTRPIPYEADLDLVLVSTGPVTDTGTWTTTGASYQVFGPEIYYEVPGSFQGAVVARITDASSHRKVDSTLVPLIEPEHPYQETSQLGGVAVFKAESPISKTQVLKTGFLLSYESNEDTFFTATSALNYRNKVDKWKARAGVGVEKKGDFLMGLQLELELAGGELETPVTLTTGATEFMGYKVVLGGEKWLNKVWAFRTGLSFENALNTGSLDYQMQFFPISDGQRIVTTSINVGVGLKEESFRGDFMLWYGQPNLFDSPSPQTFANQLAAQISLGIFLK